MSSNQKTKKRTTSTARRINTLWVIRLLRIFLITDFFILILIPSTFIYAGQKKEFGKFEINRPILFNQEVDSETHTYDTVIIASNYSGVRESSFGIRINRSEHIIEYVVIHQNNEMVTDITIFYDMVLYVCIALLILELIVLINNILFGIFAVRRKLKSLNQMALLANELGNQAENKENDSFYFSEDQVHNLEDAISKITPNGPDCTLHTSDEELKGLEYAINGLLERMRQSYKQQSRFVSDASHELRTPIAVIQGYVNMLDRWGKEDPQVLAESIDAIKHESEHMKKLVEQLLFLARGDSGRNKFVLEKVDLNDVVKEVYEESLMIDEDHIYHSEYTPDSNIVYADSSMLKQSVRILTDNAAKYTPKHEQIRVGCGIDPQGIPYIYVQDNGIGMKDEQTSHVFERFYRADNARDSKTGGTGLGLSIAKWIIDRHGGYFKVISYEEIGTRISIYLPQNTIRKEWGKENNGSQID